MACSGLPTRRVRRGPDSAGEGEFAFCRVTSHRDGIMNKIRVCGGTSAPSRVAARLPAKSVLLLCVIFVLASSAFAAAPGCQTYSIERWTVLVSERLLSEDKEATAKALELLRVQLQEIIRVVPAEAVAKLREV